NRKSNCIGKVILHIHMSDRKGKTLSFPFPFYVVEFLRDALYFGTNMVHNPLLVDHFTTTYVVFKYPFPNSNDTIKIDYVFMDAHRKRAKLINANTVTLQPFEARLIDLRIDPRSNNGD